MDVRQPFEGNNMLSIILSKAPMLPADDEITDPGIKPAPTVNAAPYPNERRRSNPPSTTRQRQLGVRPRREHAVRASLPGSFR